MRFLHEVFSDADWSGSQQAGKGMSDASCLLLPVHDMQVPKDPKRRANIPVGG